MSRLLTMLAVLLATAARADEVLVFAAASTSEAMTEVAKRFEKKTHLHVVISFGGSSLLARQIEQGAPADVFLSADEAQVKRLGAQVREQRPYLSNHLVVIVPRAHEGDLTPGQLGSVKRLSLADPQAVPAGVYAKRWLARIGEWDQVASKVVPALDVRAALAAVESEAADAGIVYATDAAISSKVRVTYAVPAKDAPEIVYPLVLLEHGGEPAKKFYAFLLTPESKAAFSSRGFVLR